MNSEPLPSGADILMGRQITKSEQRQLNAQPARQRELRGEGRRGGWLPLRQGGATKGEATTSTGGVWESCLSGAVVQNAEAGLSRGRGPERSVHVGDGGTGQRLWLSGRSRCQLFLSETADGPEWRSGTLQRPVPRVAVTNGAGEGRTAAERPEKGHQSPPARERAAWVSRDP